MIYEEDSSFNAADFLTKIDKIECIKWKMLLGIAGRTDIEKFLEQIADLEKRKCLMLIKVLNRIPEPIDLEPYLFKKIDDLDFTVRTCNGLKSQGFVYAGDFLSSPKYGDCPERLKHIPNLGKKSLIEILETCKAYGYEFRERQGYMNERLMRLCTDGEVGFTI
jgi:DNA-directed RNA polymerase alpha subunit